MNISQAPAPNIKYSPTGLVWRNVGGKNFLKIHFQKHKVDAGDCLKKSMPVNCSFDIAGYEKASKQVPCSARWIFEARVREAGANSQPLRHWYLVPNLFCVLVSVGNKNDIVSAYHHHLHLGRHGHDKFEKQFSSEKEKQDGFLDWLDQSEILSASASALRGKASSHVIEDLVRIAGF